MTTQNYSPGLDGVIATETSVSYLDIDVEQILVRGYDLIELAELGHVGDPAGPPV